VLCIGITEKIKISIGKLGLREFERGIYMYIGSALQSKQITQFKPSRPGPLLNRVQRHTKTPSQKKMHWHIDYLLADPHVHIIRIGLFPNKNREECEIAAYFNQFATSTHHNFGCSDCSCHSHLLYFSDTDWVNLGWNQESTS
jgi:Uri superfamily endonuclease